MNIEIIKESTMKKILILFVGVILVSTLIGCETVKGIGKDIENTGDNIWEGLNRGK